MNGFYSVSEASAALVFVDGFSPDGLVSEVLGIPDFHLSCLCIIERFKSFANCVCFDWLVRESRPCADLQR